MRYRVLMILAVLGLSACASAPQSTSTTQLPQSVKVGVYDTIPGSSGQELRGAARPPLGIAAGHRACRVAQPDYPKASVDAGEHGVVKLRLFLGADGNPEKVDIAESSGHPRLDDAAIRALVHTSCDPWTVDGKPVRTSYVVPFSFDLSKR